MQTISNDRDNSISSKMIYGGHTTTNNLFFSNVNVKIIWLDRYKFTLLRMIKFVSMIHIYYVMALLV